MIACAEICHAINSGSNDAPNDIFARRVSEVAKNVEEGIPNIRVSAVERAEFVDEEHNIGFVFLRFTPKLLKEVTRI